MLKHIQNYIKKGCKMNTNELEKQIKQTQEQLVKLQEELNRIKAEGDKFVIKPVANQVYYSAIQSINGKFITDCERESGCYMDIERRNNYNYFRTREEAQKLADYFNTFLKAYYIKNVLNGGSFNLNNNDNKFYFFYQRERDIFEVSTNNNHLQTPLYIKDTTNVEKFMNIMGKDNLFILLMISKKDMNQ